MKRKIDLPDFLIIGALAAIVLSAGLVFVGFYFPTLFNDVEEGEMYSLPIGPTQEEPYQLDSTLILEDG